MTIRPPANSSDMPLLRTAVPRGVLRVDGPDGVTLLQGLVTNDVTRVTQDRAVFAALLTAQGRFLHDFHIAAAGDALLLDAEADRLPDLLRRLRLYRLRAKVGLEDLSATMGVYAVFGQGAAAAFGLPETAGAACAVAGGVAFIDARDPRLGVRAVLPQETAEAALAATGATAAPFEAWDDLRLALAIPEGSRDLPPEKALLIESGYDALNAIDWRKGCYVGQELTARTKYRGLVKRTLVPVAVEGGPLPEPGTPVERDGQIVGEMRSGRAGRALALLRLDAAAPGTTGLNAGGVPIVPADRPPEG